MYANEEKKRIGTALRVAKSATLSNAVEALRIAGIYVVVERQQGVGPTKAKIILPELFWSMDDDYLMAKAISTIMNDATCSPSIMGDGLLTFLMENIHVRTIEVFRVFLELERVADQGLMRGLHQRLKDISPR